MGQKREGELSAVRAFQQHISPISDNHPVKFLYFASCMQVAAKFRNFASCDQSVMLCIYFCNRVSIPDIIMHGMYCHHASQECSSKKE